MLDKRSRKILKYIKAKKRAAYNEIVAHFSDEDLTAYTLVDLNVNQYTMQVGEFWGGCRQAVYELQNKGYAELEEYRRHMLMQLVPIVISIISLIVSIITWLEASPDEASASIGLAVLQKIL